MFCLSQSGGCWFPVFTCSYVTHAHNSHDHWMSNVHDVEFGQLWIIGVKTSTVLRNLFQFSQREEQSQQMLARFLDKSPQQTLQDLLKFCAVNNNMLLLNDKKIEVEFLGYGFIFSSKRSMKLVLTTWFKRLGHTGHLYISIYIYISVYISIYIYIYSALPKV